MTLDKTVIILLVEDNRGDVLLTRRALQHSGLPHELMVAASGEEALAMLRQQDDYATQPRPDMVMMDLNLPKMGGKETLMAMKTDAALATIPVVVMSSSRAQQDIATSYDAQAVAYVVKPLDGPKLHTLAQTIHHYVPHFVVPQ